MPKLKNISLFSIALAVVATLYFENLLIFIFSLFLLLLTNKKKALIFLLIIVLAFIKSLIIDPIPYGCVEKVYSSYSIVNKILYKVKLNSTSLKVGQLVKTTANSHIVDDDTKKTKNIIYVNYDQPEIIINQTPIAYTYDKLQAFEGEVRNVYSNIIFNDYSYDDDYNYYFGYGLCIYYFLKKLSKKNKYLAILLLFCYSLFLGFELKFLLIIIEFCLSFFKLDKVNNLAIELILVALINPQLFNNYSFLIVFIFKILNILDLNNCFSLSIIQSLLFGEINLIMIYFYKYYLYLRLMLYLFLLTCFALNINIYLPILHFLNNIFKLISMSSIKGQIKIIFLLLFLVLFRSLHINNNFIKQLIISIFIFLKLNNPLLSVSFIDVGQGDAILISTEFNKENVLIDTGSKYNYYKLKKFLNKQGVHQINYLIITHDDSDHNGNVTNLLNDFKIQNIITENQDIELSNLYLKNLYYGVFDNDNENSLIYYTKIDDYYFLFTGDITANIEKLITNDNNVQKIDILKVSHHGSNTASSKYFIGYFKPSFAVISTNGQYNHPSQETITNLNSYFVDTLITKNEGDIIYYFSDIIDFIKTSKNRFVIINL